MIDKIIAFSLFDLVFIFEGFLAREVFFYFFDFVRLVEKRGYYRYWLVEYYNMIGIVSVVTSVLIGYLAANIITLYLGFGGVMLFNYLSLVIVE